MTVPDPPILTIEEILSRYFYKEWVKDELKEIQEKRTGTKSELIERFLSSNIVHKKSVKQLAESLLSSIRKQDLKQILRDYELATTGKKDDLLARISANFIFEPYIRKVNSYCKTCNVKTDKEIHFDDSWNANYKKCLVCNTNEPVKHYRIELFDSIGSNSSNGSESTGAPQTEDVNKGASDTLIFLKNSFWHIVITFTALITLGLKLYWLDGLIIALLSGSVITLVYFFIETKVRKIG